MLFYAHLSTTNQDLDAQTDALTAAGAERSFSERMSGAMAERPELDKMLDQPPAHCKENCRL
ncbi:recombinase family protein [Roseovarius nubinhibens]|uniref:Resolvase/invertase-type recombinase catalytic domain-containing protein n=1 Tax=Roseovarius nubinhibens TaxID=314263 RepID=A0A348WHX9_9RHOB|nr:hypothetical protein [Roseovarius nubinhibens]